MQWNVHTMMAEIRNGYHTQSSHPMENAFINVELHIPTEPRCVQLGEVYNNRKWVYVAGVKAYKASRQPTTKMVPKQSQFKKKKKTEAEEEKEEEEEEEEEEDKIR